MMKYLQKLGKALMLPVACLPICGILMGIGYALCPSTMQGGEVNGLVEIIGFFLVKAGGALIDNMHWLFVIGVAVGMTDDHDGTAGLAGLVSWLMITKLLNPGVVTTIMPSIADNANSMLAFGKIENAFIGIIAGLIGASCYNRFKNTRLPDALSFFSGKRSVAIITAVVSIAAAAILLFAWPLIFGGLVALEVVSVGVMYYTALMPCMIASLVASGFAAGMGVTPETFHVVDIPKLTIETGLKMGAIAVGCAVISIVFCMVLNGVAGAYGRWFKNPYVRVVVGSCLVIGITLLLGTSDYMGAGAELIEKAVEEGQARPLDFFWKLVLTALTMRAGFRGGEIVPSFCIGATLGCVMGNWLGFSPSICAACGMTAVFCGVTNCPITSILIAFEMFGFKGVPFYLIAVSISYAASGYYGLYKDQTIVYSKYKAKYVNKPTRF